MPRITAILTLTAALLFALACGGNDDGPTAAATSTPSSGPGPAQFASPTPVQEDNGDNQDSEPTGEPEPLGNGEAIPFQTAGGETIQAVLLSVPGPNQNVIVFTADNPGQYRDAYAEVVRPGVAVLVFISPEGAEQQVSALQTALLLARSRDYPLVYLMALSADEDVARRAAASSPVTGVIVIDGNVARVYDGGGTNARESAPASSPEALRDAILGFLGR